MNNFFFVLPEESGGAPFVGESQTLLFREREDVFVSRDSSSVCSSPPSVSSFTCISLVTEFLILIPLVYSRALFHSHRTTRAPHDTHTQT